MMQSFVEDWSIEQVLGEGAFGEVKLLRHRETNQCLAMKTIDLLKHRNASSCVRKEICIQGRLRDSHIIRYFGHRTEKTVEYIFLEYAPGGELFNKIEPDIGMSSWEAQKYFKDLLAGVDYMHRRGVAHRDIKPENLLLDEFGNLKITDFGMATVFKLRGEERFLETYCGTALYCAPEVSVSKYRGQPCDIWSCGIVLVAMLSGELPWDEASPKCIEFRNWRDGKYAHLSPWVKMDTMALSLVKRMLNPTPSLRCTIPDIMKHRWYLMSFEKSKDLSKTGLQSSGESLTCWNSNLSELADDFVELGSARLSASQPEPHSELHRQPANDETVSFCFSQPIDMDDLLLTSKIYTSALSKPGISQDNVEKLVRRMTRFFVKCSCEAAMVALCHYLGTKSNTLKQSSANMLTICTKDKRKLPLYYKANILDMDGKTLIDFRLSKGCGLEFKRHFLDIKESLSDIVIEGLAMWSTAPTTKCSEEFGT